eukprot:gene13314-13443_t
MAGKLQRLYLCSCDAAAYVQALYLDPSFSHQDWSKALQDSLAASFKARNAADVAELTQELLAQLGDPYTRLLQGDDAAALAAEEQGKGTRQWLGSASGLILDLRDNVGGIVEAGVDIAQDFLRADQVLCIAVDRSGQEERVVLPSAHTLTNLPLGRSQRVVQLADGKSTLLVSTIKYFTPQGTVIDKVGLQPDVVCDPEEPKVPNQDQELSVTPKMKNIVTATRHLSAELEATPDIEQLQDWAHTALASKASGIHELIIHQAIMHPEKVAVVDALTNTTHTYGELQAAALAVADALACVPPGFVVAVALPRGFELVASLLGVMLAGCVWVYLDPSYPDAHKKVVIEDSAAHLVITNRSSTIPAEIKLLIAAEILSSPATAATGGVTALPNPDNCFTNGTNGRNLMAIMYTSGSTGRPKGVCLEHAAVLASMILEPWSGVCQEDVFAQCSSCGFPGSLHDCWLPLVRGATMVIIPREVLLEPAAFAATVAQHGITSAFLTPRVLELYADSAPASLDGLRRVWVAGEAVRPDAMALLAARPSGTQLWNLYGCTEHCGCISGFKVTPENAQALSSAERCPIGSPTSGVKVVLLDANRCVINQPGVQGEIWIAGPQLSKGYHNLSAVTSERFVLLPELATSGQPPSRFYRTGDLGMWRLPPGGSSDSELVLDHMGRAQGVDSMVKVNGYQIDRAALPAPVTVAVAPANGIEAISDELQAAVAAAMERVLGLAAGSVRSADSFVYDLGANSLKAAAAAADAHPVNAVLGLASHYANAIQMVQPAGPYTLSGVGRGSLIAYELGRELEARQQRVTAVAALDYVFRPGVVRSPGSFTAASDSIKDFLTVSSHMTVVTRLLAGGRAEGLSEQAAARLVAQLEQTLAADDNRAARSAAIKQFISSAVAPAIATAALRAFNTLGKAMNYDPLTGRGLGAPLLQAPLVVVRAEDQEFMDAIFRMGNGPDVSPRDLGWHQASAVGPATIVDVPGSHMNLMLTSESAAGVAALFEHL